MITASQIRIGNWFMGYDDRPFKFGLYEFGLLENNHCELDEIIREPITLTPEILKSAGFEDWGSEVINEWETCHYYAVHNFIEGTSDIKVCFITSNYGDREPYSEWVFKIDNDTIYNKGLEYFHQLQNLIFALTHQELTINLHATA